MARIIDENQYTNNVAFDFENKLNSEYVRLIEENPQPCVYYSISDPDSSVDDGLYNVERHLGSHSPIRYKKIDNLPIYMDNSVILDLNEADEGLTTSFEAEAKIMPGTVIPYPDDYFYIKYLGKKFMFRVTEVAFDTVKSFNYYKINFTIKSVGDSDTYNDLEFQTVERHTCIVRNIGTDDKCIVEDTVYQSILLLNEVYDKLADMYLRLFYSTRYNALLYSSDDGLTSVYDRFITKFINDNNIFHKKYDYETTSFIEVDFDRKFLVDYEHSIFKKLELHRFDKIEDMPYVVVPLIDTLSTFALYSDKSISTLAKVPSNLSKWYLPEGIIYHGETQLTPEEEEERINKLPIFKKIISKYISNKVGKVSDIRIEELNIMSSMDYDWNSYISLPIVLFILKSLYKDYMKRVDR